MSYRPSYAEKALRDGLWRLGREDSAELSDQLHEAAYRIGQLIAGGMLDEEEAENALGARAMELGMLQPDAYRIIYAAFDEARKVPVFPKPETPSGPRIMSFASFEGQQPAEREWIVEDWIPAGSVTVLFGDGGTGKSLLSQQLASCVSAGIPFLGLPVRQSEVFSLFCEDDVAELHRRQLAINSALGIEFSDLAESRFISAVGADATLYAFTRGEEGRATDFAERIAGMAEGAGLIIIDTAADTFGGNEVNRYQVRQFMTWLNKLAKDNNAAVILLAHPSLTGMSSNRGQSGSTAWTNSARSHLYLQHQDDDADSKDGVDHEERLLSRKKSNYAAKGEQIALRLSDGVFRIGTPKEKVQKPKSERLTDNQRICMAALRRAIDADGFDQHGDPQPDGSVRTVRVVRIALWREYSQNQGLGVNGDSDPKKQDDRFRRAFADCLQSLQSKQLVRIRGDVAWIV